MQTVYVLLGSRGSTALLLPSHLSLSVGWTHGLDRLLSHRYLSRSTSLSLAHQASVTCHVFFVFVFFSNTSGSGSLISICPPPTHPCMAC